MENKMNKFGVEKLLAVLAVALACVCMWGCSDEALRWVDNRSLGGVVGFVDDSLVIVSSYHYWHEEVDPAFGTSYDREGRAHPGLSLYNYRVQLDGPVWSDTLDNSRDDDFEYIKGQLADSVIWGGDPKSEVSFWKIGDKPHRIKIKKAFDGCSIDVPYTTKLRPWLDGKILVMGNKRNPDMEGFALDSLGSDYCQYAVLDTVQKVITYKKLDGDLVWVRKCDDVRAWGDDVYCSVPGEHPLEGHILKNNTDTLLAPLVFSRGIFWGEMIELRASICRLEKKLISCLDPEFTWREPLKFYQNNNVVVELE